MTYIFVFGSNTAGRHGKGAALDAIQRHGAIYGQGEGLQGQSYAIPTKAAGARGPMRSLTVDEIKPYAERFVAFARSRPDLHFRLTPIGCGLAGHKPKDIAPMFWSAPDNVSLPEEFVPF